METRKELGKICRASWGMGGYQECMVGLTLTFEGKGWGISSFDGTWGIERSNGAKWTEEERLRAIGEAAMKAAKILQKIGKRDVKDLEGVPVECTFEGTLLKDWRILHEVL